MLSLGICTQQPQENWGRSRGGSGGSAELPKNTDNYFSSDKKED